MTITPLHLTGPSGGAFDKTHLVGLQGAMVTIHRHGAFRFVIFLNDHSPAHVHAFKGNGQAKIRLDDQEVLWSEGLSSKELQQVVTQVRTHHSDFAAAWERIHG